MSFEKDFLPATNRYNRQTSSRVELPLMLKAILMAVALLAVTLGFVLAHFVF